VNRLRCPECDGFETELVHTSRHHDTIEETFICNDCPTQFVNKYNLFDQEIQEVPSA
jgi:uncharacterized protein YbaR (Trm112 family)